MRFYKDVMRLKLVSAIPDGLGRCMACINGGGYCLEVITDGERGFYVTPEKEIGKIEFCAEDEMSSE